MTYSPRDGNNIFYKLRNYKDKLLCDQLVEKNYVFVDNPRESSIPIYFEYIPTYR